MRKNSIKKMIAFVGLSCVMCLNMSSIVFAEEQTSKFEVSPTLEDVTNALENYYDEGVIRLYGLKFDSNGWIIGGYDVDAN